MHTPHNIIEHSLAEILVSAFEHRVSRGNTNDEVLIISLI
jgi:hypothetical protein